MSVYFAKYRFFCNFAGASEMGPSKAAEYIAAV